MTVIEVRDLRKQVAVATAARASAPSRSASSAVRDHKKRGGPSVIE